MEFHQSLIDQGLSYKEYKSLIISLIGRNHTTGKKQSEDLSNFTKLNLQRMERIDKTFTLSEEFASVLKENDFHFTWLVLAEAWCGDCAQNLPGIAKIANTSEGKIDLRIYIRDEYPELMNSFLTNGAMSIPKLISLRTNDFKITGTWGPRPKPVQDLLYNYKNNPKGRSWDDFERELHTWYAKDKNKTIQEEFVSRLNKWIHIEEISFDEKYNDL